MIELQLPKATPSNNKLLRMHWSARRKVNKQWHDLVLGCFDRRTLPRISGKAHVVITRYSSHLLDKDNLYGGAKPVVDALKDLSIIVDDSPQHLELQVKQDRGRARTVVQLKGAA